MIMAISHTHSALVRSFMPNVAEDGYDNSKRNDPNSSHVSDPVRRYAVYKKMYLANKLNSVFPKLEVEEMKSVMKASISDNEIEWLRDYVMSRGGGYSHAWLRYNRYYQYFDDKYYSEENKTMWNNKFHFLEYGIPYQKYLVPQWIVLQLEPNVLVLVKQVLMCIIQQEYQHIQLVSQYTLLMQLQIIIVMEMLLGGHLFRLDMGRFIIWYNYFWFCN